MTDVSTSVVDERSKIPVDTAVKARIEHPITDEERKGPTCDSVPTNFVLFP